MSKINASLRQRKTFSPSKCGWTLPRPDATYARMSSRKLWAVGDKTCKSTRIIVQWRRWTSTRLTSKWLSSTEPTLKRNRENGTESGGKNLTTRKENILSRWNACAKVAYLENRSLCRNTQRIWRARTVRVLGITCSGQRSRNSESGNKLGVRCTKCTWIASKKFTDFTKKS